MKKQSVFDEKMWKFLLVGILNTVVGYGLTYLFLNVFHWGFWLSTIGSYVLASVMSYFLNRYFTFRYEGETLGSVLRFALNIAVCYLASHGLARLIGPAFFRWFLGILPDGLNRFLARLFADPVTNLTALLAMCFFVVFNYLGQRFFAFREKK